MDSIIPHNTPIKTSQYAYIKENRLHSDMFDKSIYITIDEIQLLRFLADSHLYIDEIIYRYPNFGINRVIKFLEIGALVPAYIDENRHYNVHFVDIETCRACNARCNYCPQSISPKHQAFLPIAEFKRIVKQLSKLNIKWVALNHYNEPTMDPHFESRLKTLKENGLPLRIFTNGTIMKSIHYSMLKASSLETIVFNFPSLDSFSWSKMMRLPIRLHCRAIHAIENFINFSAVTDIKTEIAVNLVNDSQIPRVKEIKEFFGEQRNFRVTPVYTNTRAGNLDNSKLITCYFDGKYSAGCKRVVNHLHISYRGDVYQCCQDYYQNNILGNINDNTLSEIVVSDAFVNIRKQIYGNQELPINSICRKCTNLRTDRFNHG